MTSLRADHEHRPGCLRQSPRPGRARTSRKIGKLLMMERSWRGPGARAEADLGIPRYWGDPRFRVPARSSPIWVTPHPDRLGASHSYLRSRHGDRTPRAAGSRRRRSDLRRDVVVSRRLLDRPANPGPGPGVDQYSGPGAGVPGAPAPGTMYYGASVPHSRSLANWEDELGSTLALHRSYFTPDDNETDQLVHRCRTDLDRGRLPHVSIKPSWAWQDIASGVHDHWLDELLTQLGEMSASLIFTLHHEPENN